MWQRDDFDKGNPWATIWPEEKDFDKGNPWETLARGKGAPTQDFLFFFWGW